MSDACAAAGPQDREAISIVPFNGTAAAWDGVVASLPESTFCHLAGWREIMTDVLGHDTAFEFPPRVAERGEDFILWVIHEEITVGQVKDAGAAVSALPVPARVPQLPADLERNVGLAGARRHGQEHAALPLEKGLHRAFTCRVTPFPQP